MKARIIVGVFLLTLGACGTPDAAPEGERYPAAEAAEERDVEVSEIRALGEALDTAAAELRRRTEELRLLPVNVVREQLEGHAQRLERLDAVLQRQGELLRADTAGFGEVAGIHEDEHRMAREELSRLRTEVEGLRGAPPEDFTRRWQGHLDGVERVLSVAERSAAHMRRVVAA